MSFVEPLFLLGLLAAGLPVIVHLINRRKAVRRPFPAMRFLLESSQREARGIKVRQWLLMALRILIIALLAFSLAKPFVLSASGVAASDRMPTGVVFVVDTSYSMGNDDWWARAEEALDEQLGELRPWDEVALVTTAGGSRGGAGSIDVPVGRLTGTHAEVADALDELAPSESPGDLVAALQEAADILSTSQLPNREIVVVSDFARGSMPELGPDSAAAVALPYEVEAVSVRGDEVHPESLAITDVDYAHEGGGKDAVWRIDTTVRNWGDDDAEAEIRLRIGDEAVSGGLVEVEAGGSATHTFRHRMTGDDGDGDGGVRHASVDLVDPDALPVDDARHLAVLVEGEVDALLVNGEPSGTVYRDELFFLERALNPGGDSPGNITPHVTTREGLEGRDDLDAFDVVVLANVSQISPLTAKRLEAFVEGGGGLLIAMGDQVDTDAYNQNLGELLPKPLRGHKQLAEPGDPDAPLKVTRFGQTRRQHPIFQVFDLPGGASLQSAEVLSYMLLEPSPPEQSTTLLSYKDAAPALLERQIGKGRVLLLTTSVDDEWTALPYRPAYLPLVRRATQYLARRATSEGEAGHVVGEPVRLDVGSLVQERVVVVGPDEVPVVLEPVDGEVTLTPKRSGFYAVYADAVAPENVLPGLSFAVNVDVGPESDLAAVSDDAPMPWTTPEDAAERGTAGDAAAAQKRVNLWPTVLFLITLMLLLESVLGTRRSVLARIGRRLRG